MVLELAALVFQYLWNSGMCMYIHKLSCGCEYPGRLDGCGVCGFARSININLMAVMAPTAVVVGVCFCVVWRLLDICCIYIQGIYIQPYIYTYVRLW
jgi:hypothetical protein